MTNPTAAPIRTALTIRRIAKVWSLVSIAFLLLIFIGEVLHPTATQLPTLEEGIAMVFFPVGVCLGMLLAWRREGLGGAITVVSMLAFYLWMRILRGCYPRGPYFLLVAAPGLLFLACWVIARNASRGRTGAV
jgi:hypothetical protein